MDEKLKMNIQKADSQFVENDFYNWCKDVMNELEEAWSNKDIELLAEYETKQLFSLHQEQLKNMEQRNVKNVVKDIQINSLHIVGYEQKKDLDRIEVNIEMSLIDYYCSIDSAEILRGSSTKKRNVKYKVVFVKDVHIQSDGFQSLKSLTVCPYCGAPIDLKKTSHCEYCQRDIHARKSCYKIAELEILTLV
jgi:hypothetical protein